ncbi:hypothetical protein [Paenibacillus pini]|uniref:Uncharacterized protein n=1 Tax=Paenibacillus pini JCM 16418 TaxID=1236976 RepID=W7YWP6_9BACL|nr:hypothetical protein [Paenibacillus pini]GAF06794.1 hypothetical protein JCM16418_776 [Paenibacillus pini JCM 16418]
MSTLSALDRYWSSMLYLFSHHNKLSRYMNSDYIDIPAGTVNIPKLKQVAKPWSNSEKFMLNLALHLFNERNKVNLSDMDHLDANNSKLAFNAMQIRFQRG